MNKFFIGILFFITSSIQAQNIIDNEGAIIRSDTLANSIYLCFTGHEYIDGFPQVLKVLKKQKVKASFFLTGDFVRANKKLVQKIAKQGHYVGAHSNKHLLYCDWENRDSLLYTEQQIEIDISDNIKELEQLNIFPTYFMPPYEWYNKKVVAIAAKLNQTTINYSPGTRSNADYTTPDMENYISSQEILQSIYNYESQQNMNGFHLLIHPGTSERRTDKLYCYLSNIIKELKSRGYQFSRF